MTTDYIPIDCDQHSLLEVLAMGRRSVRVEHVSVDGQRRVDFGRVVDVKAHEGAEYLVIAVGSERRSLRLDRLEAIDVDSGRVYRRQ
jgi:transcriptional antiterminator Rof (Rho-off)